MTRTDWIVALACLTFVFTVEMHAVVCALREIRDELRYANGKKPIKTEQATVETPQTIRWGRR